MNDVLAQLETAVLTLAGAAVTAFIAWAFTALRTRLGIEESDTSEASIRRAVLTEAGKLIAFAAQSQLPITNISSLFTVKQLQAAANKIIFDLPNEVKLTGYTQDDIIDMILGELPNIIGSRLNA